MYKVVGGITILTYNPDGCMSGYITNACGDRINPPDDITNVYTKLNDEKKSILAGTLTDPLFTFK